MSFQLIEGSDQPVLNIRLGDQFTKGRLAPLFALPTKRLTYPDAMWMVGNIPPVECDKVGTLVTLTVFEHNTHDRTTVMLLE